MFSAYSEDQPIPENQPPIITKNVQYVLQIARFLTSPDYFSPTIGALTAPAGTGKTVAAQILYDTLQREQTTVLPICIKVKVSDRSPARTLMLDILECLHEKPRKLSSNIQQIRKYGTDAIERNNPKIMIFDEGDLLREEGFETVRHILDKTGCPMFLIGLPYMLQVIERHEKFDSRVGMRVSFQPLSQEEMLSTILPNIHNPFWSFDPENEEDRFMGIEIYSKVNSSLRKLRNLLHCAGIVAKGRKAEKITLPIIHEAVRTFGPGSAKKKVSFPTPVPQQGSHEELSRQRNEAKEEKKDHGKA